MQRRCLIEARQDQVIDARLPPGACTKNRFDDLLLEGRIGCSAHATNFAGNGRSNRQRQGRWLDSRDKIDSIREMRSVKFDLDQQGENLTAINFS